jgi:hypothetical protein
MNGSSRYVAGVLGLSLYGLTMAGCALRMDAVSQWALRGWSPTVAKAEQRAIESNRAVLFYFKDGRIQRDEIARLIEEVISEQPSPRPVRCILYNTIERDRRYAAQFDAEIPPSLILVFPDGSYAAQRGPLNRETIVRFLSESQPPGVQPTVDPYLRSRLVSVLNP